MYKVEGIEVISELPTQLVSYDYLTGVDVAPADSISAEVKRRHLQMQIRLIEIGMLDGVIGRLSEECVLLQKANHSYSKGHALLAGNGS